MFVLLEINVLYMLFKPNPASCIHLLIDLQLGWGVRHDFFFFSLKMFDSTPLWGVQITSSVHQLCTFRNITIQMVQY